MFYFLYKKGIESHFVSIDDEISRLQEMDSEARTDLTKLEKRYANDIVRINEAFQKIDEIWKGSSPDSDISSLRNELKAMRNELNGIREELNEIKKAAQPEKEVDKEKLKQEILSGINGEFLKMQQAAAGMKEEILQERTNNQRLSRVVEQQERTIQKLREHYEEMQAKEKEQTPPEVREPEPLKRPDISRAPIEPNAPVKPMEPIKPIEPAKPIEPVKHSALDEVIPVFGDNPEKNQIAFRNILSETKSLKEEFERVLTKEDEKTYLKLVSRCFEDMEKLAEKYRTQSYAGAKLAKETGKILSRTVFKALHSEKVKKMIEEYLKKCGLRKISWEVGEKLADDDYAYLGAPILTEEVSDSALDRTVREIRKNAYVLDYMEDEEKEKIIFEGIYVIGKYPAE